MGYEIEKATHQDVMQVQNYPVHLIDKNGRKVDYQILASRQNQSVVYEFSSPAVLVDDESNGLRRRTYLHSNPPIQIVMKKASYSPVELLLFPREQAYYGISVSYGSDNKIEQIVMGSRYQPVYLSEPDGVEIHQLGHNKDIMSIVERGENLISAQLVVGDPLTLDFLLPDFKEVTDKILVFNASFPASSSLAYGKLSSFRFSYNNAADMVRLAGVIDQLGIRSEMYLARRY